MEYIDFLKYGAIGISLALALLAFRLLSKEQENAEERPAMLKSIRNYFIMAVFLSVFFGVTEIVSQLVKPQTVNSNPDLERIWKNHFSQFDDTTASQKVDRISDYLDNPKLEIDTQVVCEQFIKQAKEIEEKLAEYDNGFYQNIIKLKKQLKLDPEGWTNLNNNQDSKTEIFKSLEKIFDSLGYNLKNPTQEEIVDKWIALKKGWSTSQHIYVFNSDLTELIKIYLKQFENK
ncbi:MAG: hypothetical protein K9H64_22590 [Bacteroidales bacterium]|nr:hypothetical protein [Bacteroidales bacterium]